jgi:chemotaxis methyl-accepting protein methylase
MREEMPGEIAAVPAARPTAARPTAARPTTDLALDDHRGWARFDDFLRELLARLDLSWSGYRRPRRSLRPRLVARMGELGLRDYDEYLDHVAGHPEEEVRLAAILAVTISRFFRDREDWVEVAEVAIRELAARGRPVRAASLGCASGEEPYSLRMLWMERQPDVPLQLLAADVRADVLARAVEAVYTATSVHSVPPELRARYFAPGPEGTYRLDRRVAAAVRFAELDLTRDPLPGPFDLLLCRNVAFTYLGAARQREVAARLWAALAPGGFLMIGGGERLPAGTWELVRAGRCLYRRGAGG